MPISTCAWNAWTRLNGTAALKTRRARIINSRVRLVQWKVSRYADLICPSRPSLPGLAGRRAWGGDARSIPLGWRPMA